MNVYLPDSIVQSVSRYLMYKFHDSFTVQRHIANSNPTGDFPSDIGQIKHCVIVQFRDIT